MVFFIARLVTVPVLLTLLPLPLTGFCIAVSISNFGVNVPPASNLSGERSKFLDLFSSQYPENNNVFISLFKSFVRRFQRCRVDELSIDLGPASSGRYPLFARFFQRCNP